MLTRDGNIDYETLVGEAMREAYRGVVRTILHDVAANGLRGEHHYFVSFYTQAPGVSVSRRLIEKYPAEMTIVLQHKFWDLTVLPDRFEVKLAFNGIPERLVVPYSALKVFFDPSVRFGHQFDEPEQTGEAPTDETAAARGRPRGVGSRAEKKRTTTSARKRPEIVSDDHSQDTLPEAKAEAPIAALPNMPAAAPPPPPAISDSPKVVSLDQFRKK
jgi:uncharacterized protein